MLQNELSEALSAPMANSNMEDDEDLMDELNELEAMELEGNMMGMETGPALSNPIHAPAVKAPVREEAKTEDAELEAMWKELEMA
jgi:hypothetical protein